MKIIKIKERNMFFTFMSVENVTVWVKDSKGVKKYHVFGGYPILQKEVILHTLKEKINNYNLQKLIGEKI